MNRRWSVVTAAFSLCSCVCACAQPPENPGPGNPGAGRPGRGGGPGQPGQPGQPGRLGQQGPGQPGPGGERRPNPIMMALDADGDHVISPDEIKAAATALLTLDKNSGWQVNGR